MDKWNRGSLPFLSNVALKPSYRNHFSTYISETLHLPWIISNPSGSSKQYSGPDQGSQSPDLSGKLKITSWSELFQLWALTCHEPLATFPWNQREGPWSRHQNCPQPCIPHLQPVSSQYDPETLTHSVLWFCPIQPVTYTSHGEFRLLSISLQFSWVAPFIIK